MASSPPTSPRARRSKPTAGRPMPAPPTSGTSPMSSAPWPPMSFCPGSTAPSPTPRPGRSASITDCEDSISRATSMNFPLQSTPNPPRRLPLASRNRPRPKAANLQHVDHAGSSGISLPTGYQFTITLGTTTPGNEVSSAQFRVVDNNGNVLYDQPPIKLVGLSLDDGTTTTVDATSSDLAEIVAFQLDVVGPINSKHANMSSGAGIITYYVNGAMSANQSLPSNTDSDWYTFEQTNSVYSTLPQGTAGSFVQTFKAEAST